MQLPWYINARVFPVLKCINFLRIGGKVNEVIRKVFGIVDSESEVRISKFKMTDSIWRSRIQYFSEFWILLL